MFDTGMGDQIPNREPKGSSNGLLAGGSDLHFRDQNVCSVLGLKRSRCWVNFS